MSTLQYNPYIVKWSTKGGGVEKVQKTVYYVVYKRPLIIHVCISIIHPIFWRKQNQCNMQWDIWVSHSYTIWVSQFKYIISWENEKPKIDAQLYILIFSTFKRTQIPWKRLIKNSNHKLVTNHEQMSKLNSLVKIYWNNY